jgi:hypothetical protein
VSEKELIADGGKEEVRFFADGARVNHFGRGLPKAVEVVAQIEVEGCAVFSRLDRLVLVVILTAAQAFEVRREAVLAGIDFSCLAHFSIKIIKRTIIIFYSMGLFFRER